MQNGDTELPIGIHIRMEKGIVKGKRWRIKREILRELERCLHSHVSDTLYSKRSTH
jgi:hypothetical protein